MIQFDALANRQKLVKTYYTVSLLFVQITEIILCDYLLDIKITEITVRLVSTINLLLGIISRESVRVLC